MEELIYDWNEAVRVVEEAPQGFRPGQVGSVVSMRNLESRSEELETGVQVGTALYTVEFYDGEMIEIPGNYLSTAAEGQPGQSKGDIA